MKEVNEANIKSLINIEVYEEITFNQTQDEDDFVMSEAYEHETFVINHIRFPKDIALNGAANFGDNIIPTDKGLLIGVNEPGKTNIILIDNENDLHWIAECLCGRYNLKKQLKNGQLILEAYLDEPNKNYVLCLDKKFSAVWLMELRENEQLVKDTITEINGDLLVIAKEFEILHDSNTRNSIEVNYYSYLYMISSNGKIKWEAPLRVASGIDFVEVKKDKISVINGKWIMMFDYTGKFLGEVELEYLLVHTCFQDNKYIAIGSPVIRINKKIRRNCEWTEVENAPEWLLLKNEDIQKDRLNIIESVRMDQNLDVIKMYSSKEYLFWSESCVVKALNESKIKARLHIRTKKSNKSVMIELKADLIGTPIVDVNGYILLITDLYAISKLNGNYGIECIVIDDDLNIVKKTEIVIINDTSGDVEPEIDSRTVFSNMLVYHGRLYVFETDIYHRRNTFPKYRLKIHIYKPK